MLLAAPYHLAERLPDLSVAADRTLELPPPIEAGWAGLLPLHARIADAVATAHPDEELIVASGDCTTALGVLAGLRRRGTDPSVVWFDAHGDFNTPTTTPSGYLGGMPLALACGHGDVDVLHRLGLAPLDEARVVLVGARDVDPGEERLLAASRVRRVAVEHLDAALLPPGPVYLHLDLDVLAEDAVPGLRFRFPAAGGPDRAALLAALETVAASANLAAVGLACTWDPLRSQERAGAALAGAVLAAVR